MGLEDLHLGPHAWVTSTLSADPSSSFLTSELNISVLFLSFRMFLVTQHLIFSEYSDYSPPILMVWKSFGPPFYPSRL